MNGAHSYTEGSEVPNEKKTAERIIEEKAETYAGLILDVRKRSGAFSGYIAGYRAAAQETAALRSENERLKEAVKEWISVKDRVPTISTEVLVSNGHEIWIGSYRWFSVSDGAWSVIGYGPFRSMSITHWCPLPEPPKPTKKLTEQLK